MIAIVGPGAVGQGIGRLLFLRGQPVVAVAGRSASRTAEAAGFIGEGVRAVGIADVPGLADRVLITTSDTAIPGVASALAESGLRGLALHTCGAKGPDALDPLRRTGIACGVLHPLQTIVSRESGVERLRGCAFGLAGDPDAVAWGREIISLLDGSELPIAPGQLPLYHSGAVVASNGLVALFDASIRLMERAGIDGDTAAKGLAPLMRTTLDNVLARGAVDALTGPVARGDAETVRAHLEAVGRMPPDVQELYQAVTKTLLDIAHRRHLPESEWLAVAAALDRTGERR